MSSEVPRVYREIIEEVIRKTEEDNYHIGIDKIVLEDIKNTWIKRVCEYTDVSEYKIRNGYSERYPMDGYFEGGYNYSSYNYKNYPSSTKYSGQYPYPYYKEEEGEDDEYHQYDGIKQEDEREGPEEEELDSNELTESDCGIDNEGDSTKNVMLCLFDKVTRVKDKRKCILKHGFLSIGRTDYVFNIATGDLEW